MNQSIEREFLLTDKVVVLTGAAGHLGSTIATGLGNYGATLFLVDCNEDALNTLSAKLLEKGIDVIPFKADITQDQHIDLLVELVKKKYKKVDVLINNAYTGAAEPFLEIKRTDFEKAYNVIVTSAFILIQKFFHLLSRAKDESQNSSSIINIASMYGVVSPDPRIYGNSGRNNPPYYGTAKAGLIQLTKYLACHLATENIRVNVISPGAFSKREVLETKPVFHQELCNKNPLGRIGQPAELVGAVIYLSSQASSYMTGQNLIIDGGWTVW